MQIVSLVFFADSESRHVFTHKSILACYYVRERVVFDSLCSGGMLICEEVTFCGFLWVRSPGMYMQIYNTAKHLPALLHRLRISEQTNCALHLHSRVRVYSVLFYARGHRNTSTTLEIIKAWWWDSCGPPHVLMRVIELLVNHLKAT